MLNIVGTDSNDILKGDIGNDTLQGGLGSDVLDGGAGNDVLAGGTGGPSADDRFEASFGNDTVYGGNIGSDDDPNLDFNTINYLNRGFASVRVEFGSNSRSGTVVKSGGGTDTFFAIDEVRGTDGADTFIGGSGAGTQRFVGYAGNDIFDGTLGQNEVDYRQEAKAAKLTTGLTINLATGVVQDATGGTDTLIAIERVRGTENSDYIIGNTLNNRLRGDAGDDIIEGGGGNDNIDGGLGIDTVVFSFASTASVMTATDTGWRIRGPEGTSTLVTNVERLRFADGDHIFGTAFGELVNGGAGNDRLFGVVGNDTLYGLAGNDSLLGGLGRDRVFGGSGNDTVAGGLGNDQLYGQTGRDVFVFDSKLGTARTDRSVNFDRVVDFNVRFDSLWLDNAVFKKLGLRGTEQSPAKLNKAYFEVGDRADDRNDYLLYNSKTGVLSYDADGSGSGRAVEFAQLAKHLKLTYHDFFIT
jgi:Ca2+-binding RTX toxin-like protein